MGPACLTSPNLACAVAEGSPILLERFNSNLLPPRKPSVLSYSAAGARGGVGRVGGQGAVRRRVMFLGIYYVLDDSDLFLGS